MTTNPDTMVALTAALLSGKVSPQADDIRSSVVSSNPTSGLHDRTCAVLDALAALCVCESKSEVIAIGCRFEKPNAELIIASNNGPPPDLTLKHLQNIWELLRDISDHVFSRKEFSTTSCPDSPPFNLTHSYGDTFCHKLFIDVYKHIFKVAQKRCAKYLPILQAFNKQYRGWLACQRSKVRHGQAVAEWKCEKTFEKFQILMGVLNSMNEQILALQKKAWVADANEVDYFIQLWWHIYDGGREVLEDGLACDTWADDVKGFGNISVYSTLGQLTNNVGSTNEPCRLQRAIGKLCTIHFQVGTLIRFAFSARMRFMLSERTLVITPVELDAPTNKRPMPSTKTEWRKVMQGIFNAQKVKLEGTPQKAPKKEKKILRKALAQGSLVEHCECLVVAYLLRHDSPPPVSYIGCSKLSCKPCFLWLQAVGEVTNCKFNTKGSHDKWYPGWSTPALADYTFKSKIDDSFLQEVESELCEGLKASRFASRRARSDSTTSSEAGKAFIGLRDKGKMARDLKAKGYWFIVRKNVNDGYKSIRNLFKKK